MLNRLDRIFPIKQLDLFVRLRGVAGYSGSGSLTYAGYNRGVRFVGVKAKGVAGQKAALYLKGQRVTDLEVVNGKIGQSFDTRRGAVIPELADGDAIEIRQNGDVILKGAAQKNR